MPLNSLFRLLVLCLELWVQRESRREVLELLNDEKELSRLRELGDPVSQLTADRLRARIIRGSGIVSRVYTQPAAGVENQSRADGSDKGRNVDAVA